MARLETQINQIYLLSPETKKVSLILYEEALNSNSRLFLVMELRDMAKKTEANDLKKISEIILSTFRENKKLSAETLFETSLAQINQSLADFAHGGRKSWLGKFSALITLKAGSEIYLCNTGQTSAWLVRKHDVTEILSSEKIGVHPLKIFTNFSSGKIKEYDELILTTSSVFNYVSLELFNRILGERELAEANKEICEILKTGAGSDEGFAAFLVTFTKEAAVVEEFEFTSPVYAPLPEDLLTQAESKFKLPDLDKLKNFRPQMPSLAGVKNFKFKFAIPKINLNIRGWKRFEQATPAGKFFLGSFIIFILLFALNVAAFGVRHNVKKQQEKLVVSVETFTNRISEVESALIYKNDIQAASLLALAKSDLDTINGLNHGVAAEYKPLYDAAYNKVNRVSVVNNPTVLAELKTKPYFVTRAGNGFLLANQESKTVSSYENGQLTNLFLINDVNSEIRGIIHAQAYGNLIVTSDTLYRINSQLKQFDSVKKLDGDLNSLKFIAPDRAYTMDKKNNQVIRINLRDNTTQNVIRTASDLSGAQDFGADNDLYVLYPDHVAKFVNGNEQVFKLNIADQPTEANRIFVASNLYILESSKKRLMIFNKNGTLLNQVSFPNVTYLKDLYVDENQRFIYLLDENKLLQVIF